MLCGTVKMLSEDNLVNVLGFPGEEVVKKCHAGDAGWIHGSGRSHGVGNDNHSSILAWKILGEPGCNGVAKESDRMEHVINALHF